MERNFRKQRTGKVVSNKMDKTIVVVTRASPIFASAKSS